MRRSWLQLRLLVVVLLSVLVPWLLIREVASQEDFLSSLRRLSAANLSLPVVGSGIAILLAASRWRVVLRSLDYPITLRRSLYIVLATWPAAAVVPSRLADGLRAVMVRRHVPLSSGLGAVLVEKVIDLQSLGLMFLVGCIFVGWIGPAVLAGLGVTIFWAGFLAGPGLLIKFTAPLPTRFRRGALSLVAAADALRRKPRLLAEIWILSVGGWALSLAIMLGLLRATGSNVAAGDAAAVWPAAVLAGVLPITLSGLGTRDTAFLGLLNLLDRPLDPEPVLAATLLYPLVTTWLYVVVGAPFALRAVGWRGASAHDHLIDEQKVE